MFNVIEFFEIVAVSAAQAEDAGWYYRIDEGEPEGPFRLMSGAYQAARTSVEGVAA